MATGAMATAWRGEGDAVTSIASSPDGRLVAMARARKRLKIYGCEMCGAMQDLRTIASQRVRRSLTLDERQKYLHE